MTNCTKLNLCVCTSCTQEPEPTVQIEHNIQVTHVMEKVVHLKPPKKASEKVVSIAGKCLDNPDGCSIDEIKSLSASHLSIRQGHDDPVFKTGRTFVEERYAVEDYAMIRMNHGKTTLLRIAANARTLRRKTAIMDCAGGVAAVAARATADQICDNNSKMEMGYADEKSRIKDWPKDGEMPITRRFNKTATFREKGLLKGIEMGTAIQTRRHQSSPW